MRPLLPALRSVLMGCVVLLAIASVSMALLVRRLPNGETTILGHPVFAVASGSMAPTFNTGDVIIDSPISRAQAAALRPGQIITFITAPTAGVAGGLVVTHRIYSVVTRATRRGGSTVYRTKGDANNAPDVFAVSSASIIGLYQGWRIPDGGYLLQAAHQPLLFLVLALTVIGYLAITELRSRRQPAAPGAELPGPGRRHAGGGL